MAVQKIRFIDLFAGIGGFHKALELSYPNSKCVFASEIDDKCKEVYKDNFGIIPAGDITKINPEDIPTHNLLLAGFPCQPFSKGGFRKGFEDTRGTLFYDIVKILIYHKPKYILLENVQNLVGHDNGNTYKVIIKTLRDLGYSVPNTPIILSPNQFGVPALRKRIYIPGVLGKKGLFEERFNEFLNLSDLGHDAYSIVKNKYNNKKDLLVSEYEEKVIKMWDEFYKGIDIKIIGFPVWVDYFSPKIKIVTHPKWKKDFITKNQDLYLRNKKFIDKWLKKYDNLSWVKDTHRKFEWQAGVAIDGLKGGLIQFRPSGVRVKRPTHYSTLVAMNHGQILGKYMRRLSPDEAKKLQSFPDNFKLHPEKSVAMRQLGNAVNVEVVQNVLKKMFE